MPFNNLEAYNTSPVHIPKMEMFLAGQVVSQLVRMPAGSLTSNDGTKSLEVKELHGAKQMTFSRYSPEQGTVRLDITCGWEYDSTSSDRFDITAHYVKTNQSIVSTPFPIEERRYDLWYGRNKNTLSMSSIYRHVRAAKTMQPTSPKRFGLSFANHYFN